jgi:hypothetical protein
MREQVVEDDPTLDNREFARVDGIDPGSCKVTFPRPDKDAWERG